MTKENELFQILPTLLNSSEIMTRNFQILKKNESPSESYNYILLTWKMLLKNNDHRIIFWNPNVDAGILTLFNLNFLFIMTWILSCHEYYHNSAMVLRNISSISVSCNLSVSFLKEKLTTYCLLGSYFLNTTHKFLVQHSANTGDKMRHTQLIVL